MGLEFNVRSRREPHGPKRDLCGRIPERSWSVYAKERGTNRRQSKALSSLSTRKEPPEPVGAALKKPNDFVQ